MNEVELKICKGGDLGTNSYVIMSGERAIVIDPADFTQITDALRGKRLDFIVITHEHFDHVLALNELKSHYGAKVIAQRKASENIANPSKNLSRFSDMIYDVMKIKKTRETPEFSAQKADTEFDENYELSWLGHTLTFVHTPGHSEGSCCVKLEGLLFSGDSLFEAVDTSFLGGAKAKAAYDKISMPYFRSLDPFLRVCPGHGESFILGDKLNACQKATEIFKNRPKFTNFFVNFDEFNETLKNAKILVRAECCFLLVKHGGFYKFYYFVDKLENLANLDEFFRLINEPVVAEIVSKNAVASDFLKGVKFKPYKIYSRYRSVKKNRSFNNVLPADLSDASEIFELISETFDPLSDYLPSFEELSKLIAKGLVFVIKQERAIAGAAIFEIKEKICYFRLNCVKKEFQNGLIGFALASAPKQMQEAQTFYTWINDENKEAVRLNSALGYKPDGLKNYIFIKDDE